MTRTAEFVLGLIGGIFGILASLFTLAAGGLATAFEAEGAGEVVWRSWIALFVSIFAIVAAAVHRKTRKPKLWGGLLLAAGLAGLLLIGGFYLIAGPLICVAGVIGLLRKSPSQEATVSPELREPMVKSP